MSSCTGHVITKNIYGQTLALQLGNGDEQRPLELETTGLNVKGNLYFYLSDIEANMRAGYPMPNMDAAGFEISRHR